MTEEEIAAEVLAELPMAEKRIIALGGTYEQWIAVNPTLCEIMERRLTLAKIARDAVCGT